MKQNINDPWLALKDVCEYTGLSPSTIHRATQKGELKVSKKTGKNLFRREWIDRFLGE
jgi:excisionase family DNA binding protein